MINISSLEFNNTLKQCTIARCARLFEMFHFFVRKDRNIVETQTKNLYFNEKVCSKIVNGFVLGVQTVISADDGDSAGNGFSNHLC